jgi:hypothetical protein
LKFCIPIAGSQYLDCYDPLFILECSPDLIAEKGYRLHENHCPRMLVESQDEGTFQMEKHIRLNEWYDVGHTVGTIDDGDDDDEVTGGPEEWLWQAYSHNGDDENDENEQ